jgi:hypothetical protein
MQNKGNFNILITVCLSKKLSVKKNQKSGIKVIPIYPILKKKNVWPRNICENANPYDICHKEIAKQKQKNNTLV